MMRYMIPAILLLITGPAIPGYAQNALGNGRGLDNNLQAGAGSTNPQAVQRDFNAGNNIVTGNVGGLRRFHGRVGYGSPGEFSGNLPSNSLFRFQSRSIQPGGANSLGGYNLSPQSVYRSGAGVSAGDIAAAGGNQLIVPRGASGAVSPYPTVLPNGTISNQVQPGASAPTLGVPRQADGSMLQLSGAGATPRAGGRHVGDLTPRALDMGRPIGGKASAARDDMSVMGVTELQMVGDKISTVDEAMPGAAIDGSLDTQLDARPLDALPATGDQQLEQFEKHLDRNGDETPADTGAASDVYGTVADPMQTQTTEPRRAAVGGSDAMYRKLDPAPQQDPSGDPLQPTQLMPLAPPLQTASAVQLQEQLQQHRQQLRESAAPTAPAYPAAPSAPAAQNDNWFLPDSMKPAPPQVIQSEPAVKSPFDFKPADPMQPAQPMAAPSSTHMSIVGSLAGAKNEQVNRLMRQAEAQLANQRYFDADDSYRNALRLKPDHAYARVGQIHAQLGVGMIRTASYNLRRLYLKHPEMIRTRFDRKLLPAAQRLRCVREELDEMVKQTESVDPALLTAYLAYQLDEPKQMRDALDVAVQRKPNDPVVLLLRRVWLKDLPKSQ